MQAMKIVESSKMEIDELEKKKQIIEEELKKIEKEIEENIRIIKEYCNHEYDEKGECIYCNEVK